MEEIKKIFSKQIDWYKKKLEEEKTGEIDSSYIYDCAYEQFENIRRGEWVELLKILSP